MAGRSSRSTRQPGPWRLDQPPPRGNTFALVHGANSERTIAARAEVVHRELLSVAPYLDEPKFIPAVRRYLAAAAREALLDEHIRRVSETDGPGSVPSRLWEQVTAAARLAGKLASDLGLDPIGHAKIRSLSAGAGHTEASLADLVAAGKAVRESAEARMAGLGNAQELAVGDDDAGAT